MAQKRTTKGWLPAPQHCYEYCRGARGEGIKERQDDLLPEPADEKAQRRAKSIAPAPQSDGILSSNKWFGGKEDVGREVAIRMPACSLCVGGGEHNVAQEEEEGGEDGENDTTDKQELADLRVAGKPVFYGIQASEHRSVVVKEGREASV